ncbi:hypothetical protein B0T26DRAFT_523423 [Lasiosphaeria miniovina]|uniref:Uncharacterized protein n=1 Tax=Lasiosphaeria miniovina TaxID=1954250 RepID=A0AA40DI16_9PEZI|nr:uncharacterized protein B0T26DRAFT_523423 [Lasiosphaeria miniovina]KAK0701572.1 hypothetical protein B0T26DRAFT_523423 [Lasiosphaeria miniovina]
MRRLLRDAFRGLTEDDNNRRAPAQASQAGPFHGGPIPPPQGSQGQGMWPPPPGMCPPPALGTATSHHLPPSGTSVYGSPPPAHGIGVPQPLTVPYQPRPSLAGFANPQHHHHGQMAGIPAPAGMEYWYSQVAMPPRGQQPAMISPPAVLPQSSVAPQQTMTRGPLPNIPTAGTGNTSSSQGAHSSVLTLPVRPAAPETPGQLHCRWCQKCKRGLAYCTLSFICTTCRAWLCPGCSEVHRRTHNKEYVRAELRQWGAAPPPSFSNAEAICVVCPGSKEVRARMQCKYCSYALCLSCCSNSVALTMFLGPAHSLRHMSLGKKAVDIELLVVYPESWFVTEKRRSQAYHCQERPTAIMHCYRCHLL